MTKKKRKSYLTIDSDFNTFIKKVEEYKFCIKESALYQRLLSSIEDSVESLCVGNIVHLICYGLGNFSSNVVSRYQLALLLLLKDHLKVNVDIFDPVFSATELEFLGKLDLNMIVENEEGLRIIEFPTFIFMPHCPTALINNLLWSNWLPRLSNCIILGNSFTLLSETLTKHNFETKYYCIFAALGVTREFQLLNDFKYSDVFNDLSLHVFPPDSLKVLPSSFWENVRKPFYDESDVECISNKLSNISITEDVNAVI